MSNKVRKGSFVSVARSDQGSMGGFGFVRKLKRKRKDDSDDEAVTVVDSQSTAPDQTTLVDVEYTIDNRCSQDVSSDRVSHAMIEPTARRRPGDQTTRPSLRSTRHDPRLQASLIAATTATADEPTPDDPPGPPTNSTTFLLDLCTKNNHDKAFEILEDKCNKECGYGWLRKIEHTTNRSGAFDSKYDPNKSSDERQPLHSASEKQLACMLNLAMKPHCYNVRFISYAWGISRKALYKWIDDFSKNPLPQPRKTRSDKGLTLLTSEKKRRSTWTPRFIFMKDYQVKNPDSNMTQARDAWKTIEDDEDAISPYKALSDQWHRDQGAFLLSEIQRLLKDTGGSVSWNTIATLVAGSGNAQLISGETIRKFCMSLPDSSYKSTRILPHLDQANKERRYWWAIQFWIFWKSAKTFNNVQVVLVHMDEKWFWSIVVRRNNKSIPMLGIKPVVHSVHHKNHIEKTMGIVAVAYAPKQNDWKQGGTPFTVSLVRAGRKVKASRDTYRRVYKDDGSYHYPTIQENLLRKKGELYFKGMEVTGSSRGTRKEPKFSLLHDFYESVHLPNLDMLAEEVTSMVGSHCRVVIVEQFDGAGPHKEDKLTRYIEGQFAARQWYRAPQPANSPLTNVLDDCVFPALSKHVSREQGISNKCQAYSNDEIWESVQKCYESFPMDVLARAFVRHHQIVNAIAIEKGGDKFAQDHDLHFNVRNCCSPTFSEDGVATGVEMVPIFDEHNERDDRPSFRHPDPMITQDLLEENLLRMKTIQLERLIDWMPEDHEWFEDVAGAHAILRAREDGDFESDGEVETEDEL